MSKYIFMYIKTEVFRGENLMIKYMKTGLQEAKSTFDEKFELATPKNQGFDIHQHIL